MNIDKRAREVIDNLEKMIEALEDYCKKLHNLIDANKNLAESLIDLDKPEPKDECSACRDMLFPPKVCPDKPKDEQVHTPNSKPCSKCGILTFETICSYCARKEPKDEPSCSHRKLDKYINYCQCGDALHFEQEGGEYIAFCIGCGISYQIVRKVEDPSPSVVKDKHGEHQSNYDL